MTDGSRKAIFAAFFANLGIAISKFVGFLITGSASLLAETIHSAADTGNQLLLFLGGQRARKQATPTHPFGYGRERYFWTFAVALVLFSMGGMFALDEGIQKFRDPHEVESLGESASGDARDAIVAAIEASTHVDQLIHIRTEHIGPDEILVGAKVGYSSLLTADELVAAINSTEDAIRAAVPAATVIYLEPDRHRADHLELIATDEAHHDDATT